MEIIQMNKIFKTLFFVIILPVFVTSCTKTEPPKEQLQKQISEITYQIDEAKNSLASSSDRSDADSKTKWAERNEKIKNSQNTIANITGLNILDKQQEVIKYAEISQTINYNLYQIESDMRTLDSIKKLFSEISAKVSETKSTQDLRATAKLMDEAKNLIEQNASSLRTHLATLSIMKNELKNSRDMLEPEFAENLVSLKDIDNSWNAIDYAKKKTNDTFSTSL